MKSIVTLVTTFGAIVWGVWATAAMNAAEPETCVARPPELAGQRVGYELIDLLAREAWVTTNWTLEDYAEFSPGLAALHWIKNDPRMGFAQDTSLMRSPGCENDGEFTYQTMFGRTFFHIADLSGLRGRGLMNGALREGSVEKYHRLHFQAEKTVTFLRSPDGERFIRVNRPIDATRSSNELPEGWVLEENFLDAPWQVDLFGEVQVLRLADGTSFQGPLNGLPAGLE